MPAPHILLIGIGGVYNYGCEAIVRGTQLLLHERWPDARIVYASARPEDDRQRLAGIDVEIVLRKRRGRYSPANVLRQLLSYAGVNWEPKMDRLSMVDGIDAVFLIGGDLYTLRRSGYYPQFLVKFGDAVLRKGKHYVLWGASVGPFSRVPRIERDIRRHLRGVSLIAARETQTLDYLNGLGITDNVVPCADPAFAVAAHLRRCSDRNTSVMVGVNLSPLSLWHLGQNMQAAIKQQAAGVTALIQQIGCKVLLVPHVVCNFNERDDDLRYLARIRELLPASSRRHVELLDGDVGFVGTKEELIKCDLVIAARMHCAINALAATVPTLLLSYSRKAVGMAQYVYGCTDWVVPISEFPNQHTIQCVRNMLADAERISASLEDRIGAIQRDTRRAVDHLGTILQ